MGKLHVPASTSIYYTYAYTYIHVHSKKTRVNKHAAEAVGLSVEAFLEDGVYSRRQGGRVLAGFGVWGLFGVQG